MTDKAYNFKYGILGLAGIALLSGALIDVAILPKSQACGSRPNCTSGSWTVSDYGCNQTSCSCSGTPTSYTCYYELGLCNNQDPPKGAYYEHCYQYNCTCSSGSSGSSGGGGSGGEGGGDFCWSNWDCFAGEYRDEGTGTCYEYGSGPGGVMP